jgi:predicted  nucleic acid-binding Zn-ribbon protein
MDMNTLDIAMMISIAGLIVQVLRDRAAQAEAMGKLKQQVLSLEARASSFDNRFGEIERKLEALLSAVSRIEATLEAQQRHFGRPIRVAQS